MGQAGSVDAASPGTRVSTGWATIRVRPAAVASRATRPVPAARMAGGAGDKERHARPPLATGACARIVASIAAIDIGVAGARVLDGTALAIAAASVAGDAVDHEERAGPVEAGSPGAGVSVGVEAVAVLVAGDRSKYLLSTSPARRAPHAPRQEEAGAQGAQHPASVRAGGAGSNDPVEALVVHVCPRASAKPGRPWGGFPACNNASADRPVPLRPVAVRENEVLAPRSPTPANRPGGARTRRSSLGAPLPEGT